MDGHEGDPPLVLGLARRLLVQVGRRGELVGVGHETDPLQEVGERAVGVGVLEVGGHRVQLGEVLHARGVLRVVAGAQLGEVPGGVQGGVEDVGDAVAGGELVAQPDEQFMEAGHLSAGAGGQALDGGRLIAVGPLIAGLAGGGPGGPAGSAVHTGPAHASLLIHTQQRATAQPPAHAAQTAAAMGTDSSSTSRS